MKTIRMAMVWLAMGVLSGSAKPILLDDQFDLPAGFHIYRVAQPELTSGSGIYWHLSPQFNERKG